MVAKNVQEELMVRYLLGEMTEEERAQVEERFLSDHLYFEQLLALEESLVDQYATDNLPAEKREAFDKSSVSQRRENVEFTRELIEDIRQKKLAANRPMRLGVFTVVFSRPYLVQTSIAAAILLLLIAVPWIFVLLLDQRLTETQGQLAGKQREVEEEIKAERQARFDLQHQIEALQQSGPGNEIHRLLSLRLNPYRAQRSGGDEMQVIEVTARLQIVILEISLENPGSFKTYQVRITSAEKPSQSPITISGLTLEKDGATLKALISASKLERGDYSVTVLGEGDNQAPITIDTYSFRSNTRTERR